MQKIIDLQPHQIELIQEILQKSEHSLRLTFNSKDNTLSGEIYQLSLLYDVLVDELFFRGINNDGVTEYGDRVDDLVQAINETLQ